MKLLVTGSRDWDDWVLVDAVIQAAYEDLNIDKGYDQPVTLIHGNARGLDKMAAVIWRKYNLGPIEMFTVTDEMWRTQGKRAGFLRNERMVATMPDMCLAFIKNYSSGASMCADLAEAAEIPTRRWRA